MWGREFWQGLAGSAQTPRKSPQRTPPPLWYPPWKNRITAVAFDERGFSSREAFVDVESEQTAKAKPDLYVLAVGVSRYPKLRPDQQLQFADRDTTHLINALKGQEGRLFAHVYGNAMVNEQMTPSAFLERLDALTAVDKGDLVVISLSGHGVQSGDGTFYFLTPQGTLQNRDTGGVSWSLLSERLARIPGRVILLLDACRSGGMVNETVAPNDDLARGFFTGRHNGVMVLSASKGRQSSRESPDLGGGAGLFTFALTESLGAQAGTADTNHNGVAASG